MCNMTQSGVFTKANCTCAEPLTVDPERLIDELLDAKDSLYEVRRDGQILMDELSVEIERIAVRLLEERQESKRLRSMLVPTLIWGMFGGAVTAVVFGWVITSLVAG